MFEQALIHECQEELAITLSVGDAFMYVIHEYTDITVHLTLFNVVIADGVPQKLEHNDIKWITPIEIPSYNFCPADIEFLKNITHKLLKQAKRNEQSLNHNICLQYIKYILHIMLTK